MWDPVSGEHHTTVNFLDEVKSLKMTCVFYAVSLRLHLTVSDDFNLFVFNENFIHVAKLPLHTRLITHAVFLEQENRIIFGGLDGLASFHLLVKCKHEPKANLLLNPRGDDMVISIVADAEIRDTPKWVKGLKWFSKNNDRMLVAWNQY